MQEAEPVRLRTPIDWIETGRYVLVLSWAMTAGPVLQTLVGMIDYAMVSELGELPLGAVGLGTFIFMFAETVLGAIAVGVQIQVAGERGEGGEGRRGLLAGSLLAVAVGIPLSLALHFISPWLFGLQAASPEMADAATDYFRARNAGMPLFVAFVHCCRGYWFAHKRPETYLKILSLSLVLNVVLNWLLIFGNLGFPRLGAAGAGWATAISYGVAALLCLVTLRRDLVRAAASRLSAPARRIVQVGLPALVSGIFGLPGLGPIWLAIVAQMGDSAVAAGAVLMQISLLFGIAPLGSSLAAATLVSEALGRGSVEEARGWMYRIGVVVVVTLGAAGLLVALFAGPLMRTFLTDPTMLGEATFAVRVLGLTAGFQSVGPVFLTALFATPYAGRAGIVPLVFIWLLGVPLAAALVSGGLVGLQGAFLVLFGAFVVQTVVLGALWTSRGWGRQLQLSGVGAR